MNTTLWILQCVTAVALLLSGCLILLLPKERLEKKLSWVREYSNGMRYFICVCKICGAAGLVLPMYLHIMPVLTPVAACFIALFMLFAMGYHLRKKEYKDLPATFVFFALALFIAYNRF